MGLFKKNETYYYEEYDEIEDDTIDYSNNKIVRIINILFVVLLVSMIMITIDIVGVSRYNVGPFFSIKTRTYNDGGTKEYYGLGYKVIKYYQQQGRRDTVIGYWNMNYNVNPVDYKAIDLAIDLTNNPEETYKLITNKLLRINGNLSKINKEKNQIIIKYYNKDSYKYDLEIVCTMANKNNINKLEENNEITLIGTVKEYRINNKKSNKLYIDNCFAE